MTPPLEPDKYYHIFNRANGDERIFTSEENYRYFLEKYQMYISPVADTFCYCLMPNHFHFLIRIKSEAQLLTLSGFGTLTGLSHPNAISRKFSHLFNSYTQAFNKQESRKGSLFMRPYKRKQITTQKYFRKLVHYIHFNPVESSLCQEPGGWTGYS